jgi:hypothetical protein
LRTPEASRLVRISYFRENMLHGNLSISDEQDAISSAKGPSLSLANKLGSVQADLYFESAPGYGNWRILCSRPFLSDLARDKAQLGPVLKRLKYVLVKFLAWTDTKKGLCLHRELSLGCFTETNQNWLTKDNPIEIDEASLPGSMRLVASHRFGSLVIHIPDVSKSILLMSSTSLARMYELYSLPHVITTEHSWDSMRPKVLSQATLLTSPSN